MTAHPIDTEALRRLAEYAVIDVQGADRCQALGIMPAAYQLHRRLRETARALPALLDENAALRARIKAVQNVLDAADDRGPIGLAFDGTPFPAFVSSADIRRALDA